MENCTFKSVMFGGFAKQDVIHYIERACQESAAVQEKLRQENEGLQNQVRALTERTRELEDKAQELTARKERLEADLGRESAARQALEPLGPEGERLAKEVARLTAELERLRPDAAAYAQFRERIGAIECEARKRAADLESETAARMARVAETFRAQYQTLMSTFDATAAHVTGELRKVEVNLSQLPRAMDQAGAEWNELCALLEQPRQGE